MRRAILGLGFLCLIVFSGRLSAAQHLNQWTALNIGLGALKARYPTQYQDLILKYRPFVAEFEDGVWHVRTGNPIRGMKGGGAPAIDVRDQDQKVLKIYFQK